jgi:hypothetical protein
MMERILKAEGEELDIYYGDKKTIRYNKVPTIQRTNAIFNLSAVQGGSSSIYISPDAGISTLMLCLELPDPVATGFNYSGYALNQSWGYSALNFVQMRVGNSSLFQWSGRQLMLQAIRTAGSQFEANDLMQLAGNVLKTTGDFADGTKRFAYITLPMPWCGAESKDSPLPLPTDALSSPVQVIVNLNSVSDILAKSTGGSPPAIPSSFNWAQAFLQVKQIIPVDGARPAKKDHYALPITFVQQENSAPVSGTGVQTEIPLLGFRNGSIQELDIYCLKKVSTANAYKLNPFDYELPKDAKIIYMGNQIHTFLGYSSQYWTTVFSDKPARWNNVRLADNGDGTFTATNIITSWLQVPFEGKYAELDADEATSSSGLAVQNGIINFQLTLTSGSDYTVYYTADLQSALVMHDGTADYAF